jgi:protein-L-isoaspartate O-methyltransferase
MTDNPLPQADALNYEDWAGGMGARWLANLQGFESTIAPVGEALLARAAYLPGERALDIGCGGGGATTLAIARAVQPGGEVIGIDISPDLIAATTRRAASAGIANASFVCADAASVTLPDAPNDIIQIGALAMALDRLVGITK